MRPRKEDIEAYAKKLRKMSMKELKMTLGAGAKGGSFYKEAMKEYIRRTHK